jgi:phosphopantothenoylcysteine decarboxylase/phosphopantothenate--cysteine ligase
VTLVHDGPTVPYASVAGVESATEMTAAVLDAVDSGADALVSAAAISDYTVEASETKLRSGEDRTLDLEPTPKLIDTVRDAHPNLPIVGFKLETGGDDDDLTRIARETLERAGLSFVVANDARVLGDDETRALVVGPDAVEEFRGDKDGLGARVADELATEF